jgi:hypothetical protein
LIYKQSTLIATFRKAIKSIEKNYHIKNTTVYHPPAKLINTMKVLRSAMKAADPNVHQPGRRLNVWIVNHVSNGQRKYQDGEANALEGDEWKDEDGDEGDEMDLS